MVVNPISDLIGEVKRRRLEIALALADGHAINIESYHRLVGTYQGLGETLEMIDDLLSEKDDDQS